MKIKPPGIVESENSLGIFLILSAYMAQLLSLPNFSQAKYDMSKNLFYYISFSFRSTLVNFFRTYIVNIVKVVLLYLSKPLVN